MIAQDLYELLRGQPFRPFRIHGSDGRAREVRHPDEALVLKTRVILPLGGTGDVPESSEHLALAHIVRLEELPAPAGADA
jgi:hypothetical protein